MKNLHFALRVLAQVRTPLVFSIYGPKENTTYWQRCEQAIAILPPHIRVEYCGAVNPTNVLDVLNKQDLLFLPTLGENYGHVIAESFLAGTPVLISDCTPWCNLREKGLGEDLPLADPVPFKRYIEHVAEMSSESLHAMRCRVTEYAELISSDDAAVEANRKMFLLALGADRPDEPSPNL